MNLVVDNHPVGADYAVVSGLIAQLLGDEFPVEPVGYVFAGLVVGDGIVGHHGRGHAGLSVQAECSLDKGTLVCLETVAGVDGELAVAVVGIATALAAAAAGPVFHHVVYAVVAPPVGNFVGSFRGLEPVAISPGEVGGEAGFGSERAAVSVPTGIGAEVSLGREGRSQSQSPIFGRGDASKLEYDFGVECRSQSQHVAPHRNLSTAAGAEFSIGQGRVAGVRRVVGRDAVGMPLDQRLYLVVPSGSRLGTLYLGYEHMSQVIFLQEPQLCIAQVVGPGTAFGKRFPAIGIVGHGQFVLDAVEHEAGNLVDRQFRSQVFGPFFHRQPPVFVGFEPAGPVEVFEGLAFDRDDFYPRVRRVTQCRAIGLYDETVIFFLYLLESGVYEWLHVFVLCIQILIF